MDLISFTQAISVKKLEMDRLPHKIPFSRLFKFFQIARFNFVT